MLADSLRSVGCSDCLERRNGKTERDLRCERSLRTQVSLIAPPIYILKVYAQRTRAVPNNPNTSSVAVDVFSVRISSMKLLRTAPEIRTLSKSQVPRGDEIA